MWQINNKYECSHQTSPERLVLENRFYSIARRRAPGALEIESFNTMRWPPTL
jgi:hypothetical protein